MELATSAGERTKLYAASLGERSEKAHSDPVRALAGKGVRVRSHQHRV
jgi:hypothetical protein